MRCDDEVLEQEEKSYTIKELSKRMRELERKQYLLNVKIENTFKQNNQAIKKFLKDNMVTRDELKNIRIGPSVENGVIVYFIENASISQVKSLILQGLTVDQVCYAVGNKYSREYIYQLACELAKKHNVPKHS